MMEEGFHFCEPEKGSFLRDIMYEIFMGDLLRVSWIVGKVYINMWG
jgi:hypothetical protein